MDKRRVVVVTGAGGTGCGRPIAARFGAGGAAVVVCDINEGGGHEAASLLAAIANDPNLLSLMRAHLRRWLPRLDAAAPSFADRAIVWLATEGLWLLELLKLSPLKQTQRRQICSPLIPTCQSRGGLGEYNAPSIRRPHAAEIEGVGLRIEMRR